MIGQVEALAYIYNLEQRQLFPQQVSQVRKVGAPSRNKRVAKLLRRLKLLKPQVHCAIRVLTTDSNQRDCASSLLHCYD